MTLLTISALWGCGARKIAGQVAQKLGLELFDDDRLQEEALRMGVRSDELKALEEKAPGLYDRLMGKNPEIYMDILQSVVYKVAREGEGVIVGHGSQLLLRDFGCALHIRIHASTDARIGNLMAAHDLSHETAERLIRRKDNEIRDFFKFAFGLHFNDLGLYDLVLNTTKISTQTAVEHILGLARSDDVKECSLKALESMERLSLEKKVRALLLEEKISLNQISVEIPDVGKVYLYGIASSDGMKTRAEEIVKGIPEVAQVESDITVIKDWSY